MLTRRSTFHDVLDPFLKLNYQDSLHWSLTNWDIPFSGHENNAIRLEACPKEDVCLTLCRWRPPSHHAAPSRRDLRH